MAGKGRLLKITLRNGVPVDQLVDRSFVSIDALLHIQLQTLDHAVCQDISLPGAILFLNDQSKIPEDLAVSPGKILVMDARKEEEGCEEGSRLETAFPLNTRFSYRVS